MSERRTPTTRRKRPSSKRSSGRSAGRIVFWIVALVCIGAAAFFGWRMMNREPGLVEPDLAAPEELLSEPAGDRAVVLVFPEWDATGYVTEQRSIPSRARADEDLLEVMTLLCRGPQVSGAVSALPRGTRARAAFYDAEKAQAVLDFSQELVVGHPGGTAAEAATLTSILRTVVLNFPDVNSCIILVDGAEVETLAGHLTLDRPLAVRRFL